MAPFVFLADGDVRPPSYLRYGNQLDRARSPENFEDPKVLISSNRNPAYAWRLVAAVAPAGIYYSENFQGLRPRSDDISLPVLTALLNGHVANAWFYSHCRKRKIVLRILKRMPVPRFDPLQAEALADRVNRLSGLLHAIYRQRARASDSPLFWTQMDAGGQLEEKQAEATLLLGEIDSLVFDAYGVTERERLALMKYMSADKRPVPL
jgi:hypothetical protein